MIVLHNEITVIQLTMLKMFGFIKKILNKKVIAELIQTHPNEENPLK